MSSTLSNITSAFQNFGTSALNALSAAKEKAVQGASYVHENATVKNVAVATSAVALASAAFYACTEYSTQINEQFANAYNSVFAQPAPAPNNVVDAAESETNKLLKDISEKGFGENVQELATDMKDAFVKDFNWASDNFPKYLAAKYDNSVQYLQDKYSYSLESAKDRVNYSIATTYAITRFLGFAAFGLPSIPRSIKQFPISVFRAVVI